MVWAINGHSFFLKQYIFNGLIGGIIYRYIYQAIHLPTYRQLKRCHSQTEHLPVQPLNKICSFNDAYLKYNSLKLRHFTPILTTSSGLFPGRHIKPSSTVVISLKCHYVINNQSEAFTRYYYSNVLCVVRVKDPDIGKPLTLLLQVVKT